MSPFPFLLSLFSRKESNVMGSNSFTSEIKSYSFPCLWRNTTSTLFLLSSGLLILLKHQCQYLYPEQHNRNHIISNITRIIKQAFRQSLSPDNREAQHKISLAITKTAYSIQCKHKIKAISPTFSRGTWRVSTIPERRNFPALMPRKIDFKIYIG